MAQDAMEEEEADVEVEGTADTETAETEDGTAVTEKVCSLKAKKSASVLQTCSMVVVFSLKTNWWPSH